MPKTIGGSVVWNLDVDSSKLDKGLASAKGKVGDFSSKSLSSFKVFGDGVANTFKSVGSNVASSLTEIGNLVISKVGLIGGVGLAGLATHSAFAASRVDELTLALHAIGKANNISEANTDAAVEALRKNNIALKDSLEITSRFIQNELDLGDAIKLSTAAKDLAVIAGKDSSETTNILTEAISGQSVLMLRQFGIVTTLDEAYEKYANSIGGSTSATILDTKKTSANEAKLSKLKDQLTVAKLRMKEFGDETKKSTKVAAQMRVDELGGKISALEGNTTAYTKSASNLSDTLTEAQKKQALLNVILEGGAKVTGTYDAAMQSAGKQWRSFTGRILPDFQVEIGKAFEPTLLVVVNSLTDAVKNLGTWVDSNKDAINAFGTALADAFIKGFELIGKVVNFLSENREILIGVFVAVGLAVGAAVVAFVTAHAVAILVFSAIVAVVSLVVRAFWEWRDDVSAAIEKVKGFFRSIPDAFREAGKWLGDAAETAVNFVVGKFNEFVSFMKEIGEFIWDVIKVIASPFVWWYENIIEPIMLLISAIILRVLYEIWKFVTAIFTAVVEFLDEKFVQPTIELFNKFKDFMSSVWNFIKTRIIEPVVNAITTFVIAKWTAFSDKVKEIWNAIRDRISGPVNDAKSKVENTVSNIVSGLISRWNELVKKFKNLASSIVNAITQPFEDAKKKIEKTAEQIRKLADKINPFHRESPSLVDNVKRGLGIIKSEFEGLGDLNIRSPIFDQGLSATIGAEDIATRDNSTNQNVNIYVERVGDMQDVKALGREFGFRAGLAGVR